MPTVLRVAGFAFAICTDDHEPAHVHACCAGGMMRIAPGDAETRPYVLSARGMKRPDERKAVRIVEAHQELLLEKWREIHG